MDHTPSEGHAQPSSDSLQPRTRHQGISPSVAERDLRSTQCLVEQLVYADVVTGNCERHGACADPVFHADQGACRRCGKQLAWTSTPYGRELIEARHQVLQLQVDW